MIIFNIVILKTIILGLILYLIININDTYFDKFNEVQAYFYFKMKEPSSKIIVPCM